MSRSSAGTARRAPGRPAGSSRDRIHVQSRGRPFAEPRSRWPLTAACARRLAVVIGVVTILSSSPATLVADVGDSPPEPVRLQDSCPRNPWLARQPESLARIWYGIDDIRVADVDGDGRDEILGSASLPDGGAFVVVRTTGERIGVPTIVPMPGGSGRLTPADLDGDGDFDVIVQRVFPGLLTALLGDGRGSFSVAWTRPIESSVGQVDVHRREDGTRSILVPSASEGLLEILLDASGLPVDERVLSEDFTTHAVLVDVDGDGRRDLVSGRAFLAGTWRLRRGQAGDAWSEPEILVIDVNPSSRIEVVDLDADGRDDLLTVPPPGVVGRVRIYPNSASGVFGEPVVLSGPVDAPDPTRIATAADVDRDGDLDIVTEFRQAPGPLGAIEIHANDGTGGFTFAGWRPWSGRSAIAAGNLDGDGFADVVGVRDEVGQQGRLAVLMGSAEAWPGQQAAIPGWRDAAAPVLDRAGRADLLTVRGRTMRLERWSEWPVAAFGIVQEALLPVDEDATLDRLLPMKSPGHAVVIMNDAEPRHEVFVVRADDRELTVAATIPVDAFESPAATGDLDGDGVEDLVVLRHGSTGPFGVRIVSLAGDAPRTIAEWGLQGAPGPTTVGDLDRDGTEDLIVLTRAGSVGAGRIEVAWGVPGGGPPSAPRTVLELDATDVRGLAVADWDEDGTPDVIVGDQPWLVARGLGRRTFELAEMQPFPPDPIGVEVIDVDGDGRQDAFGGWSVAYATGDPGVITSVPRTMWLPAQSAGQRLADVDGDEHMDIVWSASGMVGVVFAGACPIESCRGDLDADGTIDFDDLLHLIGPVDPARGTPELVWDLDGDGDRDGDDLIVLVTNWGDCRVR